MKKRVWVSSVVLFALVAALAASAQAGTWKLSHVRPQDATIDKELNWFANAAKEASGTNELSRPNAKNTVSSVKIRTSSEILWSGLSVFPEKRNR